MNYEIGGLYFRGKVESPCRKCTERAVGCHGKCEAYLSYAQKVKRTKTIDYMPNPHYNKTRF